MDENAEAHVAESPALSPADTGRARAHGRDLAARALNDHTSVPSRRLFSRSHQNLVGVVRLMWRREDVTQDLSEATRILVLGFKLRLQSPHASVQSTAEKCQTAENRAKHGGCCREHLPAGEGGEIPDAGGDQTRGPGVARVPGRPVMAGAHTLCHMKRRLV